MKFTAMRGQAGKAPASHGWRKGRYCYWCNQKVAYDPRLWQEPYAATRDHLVPRSLGGSNAHWNIVVACRKCNMARGSRTDWVPYHKRVPEGELA